jgi:hypothetical protein
MQFPIQVPCTQYFTDKQDAVVPSTEEALLAACIMLVIACLSDYEDGNDMYSRNIG